MITILTSCILSEKQTDLCVQINMLTFAVMQDSRMSRVVGPEDPGAECTCTCAIAMDYSTQKCKT